MSELIFSSEPLPKAPRILFMGTPQFAVPALRTLSQWCERNGGEIVGVVSQPDRPKGRGKKLQRTPVAELADLLGLHCYQWPKLSNQSYAELRELNYDLAVVIAYGKILPKRYLTLPSWGCINLHASLLPAYRGAAPIQWALINGEEKTGVSVMRLDEGMDTGPVALMKEIGIHREDTAATLFEKLADLSALALEEVLDRWVNTEALEQLQFNQQRAIGSSHAPMLKKSDGMLDWTKSAESLFNLCRGVSPWPGAQTTTREGVLKVKELLVINEDELSKEEQEKSCGIILRLHSMGPVIRCAVGAVILTQTQRPSKKTTSGADFYRGYPLTVGQYLSEC